MRFVAISDTHCRHRSVRLPKGDVLLHAGDISYRGKRSEVVDFLDWFSKQPHKHKIFIAGNHDFFLEKISEKELKELIPDNIIYLNDSGTTIEGYHIWGSPVTPYFFKWAFNRKRGASITKHWAMIPLNTDILLAHGPAYGILDMTLNEQNAGCKDLLKRIEEIQPKAVISGHIHESYGSTKRKGIRFINASLLNESYELVHQPVVFEV